MNIDLVYITLLGINKIMEQNLDEEENYDAAEEQDEFWDKGFDPEARQRKLQTQSISQIGIN